MSQAQGSTACTIRSDRPRRRVRRRPAHRTARGGRTVHAHNDRRQVLGHRTPLLTTSRSWTYAQHSFVFSLGPLQGTPAYGPRSPSARTLALRAGACGTAMCSITRTTRWCGRLDSPQRQLIQARRKAACRCRLSTAQTCRCPSGTGDRISEVHLAVGAQSSPSRACSKSRAWPASSVAVWENRRAASVSPAALARWRRSGTSSSTRTFAGDGLGQVLARRTDGPGQFRLLGEVLLPFHGRVAGEQAPHARVALVRGPLPHKVYLAYASASPCMAVSRLVLVRSAWTLDGPARLERAPRPAPRARALAGLDDAMRRVESISMGRLVTGDLGECSAALPCHRLWPPGRSRGYMVVASYPSPGDGGLQIGRVVADETAHGGSLPEVLVQLRLGRTFEEIGHRRQPLSPGLVRVQAVRHVGERLAPHRLRKVGPRLRSRRTGRSTDIAVPASVVAA